MGGVDITQFCPGEGGGVLEDQLRYGGGYFMDALRVKLFTGVAQV